MSWHRQWYVIYCADILHSSDEFIFGVFLDWEEAERWLTKKHCGEGNECPTMGKDVRGHAIVELTLPSVEDEATPEGEAFRAEQARQEEESYAKAD
jgi:hypothetical protein